MNTCFITCNIWGTCSVTPIPSYCMLSLTTLSLVSKVLLSLHHLHHLLFLPPAHTWSVYSLLFNVCGSTFLFSALTFCPPVGRATVSLLRLAELN